MKAQRIMVFGGEPMSIFDNPNFQPLDRVVGKPTISVTENGVGFSKQSLNRLNYAHYVQMFINKVDKQLGIRPCDKNAAGAMKFVPESKKKADSLRWNNPSFKEDIKSLAPKELANVNFAVEGKYLEEENALLFDFGNAHPLN